jgi:phage terminase large subunit-like protein
MIDNKEINIISNLKEKDEVLARSYNDLLYFGRAFLPTDFLNKSASPEFHKEVGNKLIDTKPGARICNILPRGFGKSILSKAAILHKICFSPKGNRQFIAWVAEEQGQAIDHLKFVKTHLEYNESIRYYFGNLSGDTVGNRWTEKDIVTTKGDRLIAKGTSQRLRGRTEIDVRYTGIILDDFESELNTKTPERRDEIKKWIVSTVFPALEESPGREGWIWLCGTIVHYDSFLQMVVDGSKQANKEERKYPWDVTFYRALEDGKSIWPEQFPISKLESKKREFIEAGLVNKFAQEYMNDARDLSAASFKTDRIKYHDGTYKVMDNYSYLVIRNEAIPINVYIGVDIAATATQTSDFQVIMVIGVDSNKNRYVLEYYRERIPTFDLPQKIIDLARKYSPVRRVTIETVAAQEMVRDMVTRMATEDRRLIPGIFKGVKPPAGIKKADRLETSLGPVVNNKKLYIRREMTELVDEMFEHPVPKNDDLMDALYYADYYAKAPISSAISIQDMKQGRKGSKVKSYYNWMTGARR